MDSRIGNWETFILGVVKMKSRHKPEIWLQWSWLTGESTEAKRLKSVVCGVAFMSSPRMNGGSACSIDLIRRCISFERGSQSQCHAGAEGSGIGDK